MNAVIKRKMTTFLLKIIACVTMLIDHIGYSTGNMFFRGVGRIAFPIFAFLITQGFIHTRNFKKYLLRLGLFALISEIPFDLYFYGKLFYHEKQNIFFTLALGLISIYFIDKFKDKPIIAALGTVLCCAGANILDTDYGYIGVLTVVLFYVLRDHRFCMALGLLLTSLWKFFMQGSAFQLLQVLRMVALVPIFVYNGKEGYKSPWTKYGFYVFYPLHLLILYLIFN